MAEAGRPAMNAVLVPTGAMRLTRHPHRLGVEHHLGDLDQHQIGDGEAHERREELPWQRRESKTLTKR